MSRISVKVQARGSESQTVVVEVEHSIHRIEVAFPLRVLEDRTTKTLVEEIGLTIAPAVLETVATAYIAPSADVAFVIDSDELLRELAAYLAAEAN